MEKIEIEQKMNMYDLISYIEKLDSDEILFVFKKKNGLYLNADNLRIIKDLAEGKNKSVKFDVENTKHKDYIQAINDNTWVTDTSQVEIESDSAKDTLKSVPVLGFASKLKKKKSKQKGKKIKETKSDSKVRKKRGFPIKGLVFFLVIIGSIAGGMFFLWWNIPSAVVKLDLDSEVLVKLLEVESSTFQEGVSAEEARIPAFSVEVIEADSQTNPTTGEKKVGEKAKGTITITNKTDKEIKIKKGKTLKLISADDESLKYETTEDITVGAKKEEVTETAEGSITETVYGKKDVKVKAKGIGDKYNQDKKQKFEIDKYDTDELIGENENKIEGGSSETVNVVTQDDMTTLRDSLEEFLKQKVADSLKKKIVDGQVLPETSIKTDIRFSEFDKQLDEEASELTLKMEVKGVGLAYSQEDLDEVIANMIKKIIPEEYSLDEKDPEYEVAVLNVSKDNSGLTLQVKLRGFITPNIDKGKIRTDLTGMSINEAQEYLGNLNGIKKYEIVLSPNLPEFIRRMPQKRSNIVIEIKN